MTGGIDDVSEVGVAPFPVFGVQSQFRAAADGVQRTAYVMREGHYDFLAYVGQISVLGQGILQTFPVPFPALDITHDFDVRDDEQDDGSTYEAGYEAKGMPLRLGNLLLPVLEGGLCLSVQHGYKRVQPDVQFAVVEAEAVGIGVKVTDTLLLQGYEPLVQGMKGCGGNWNCHRVCGTGDVLCRRAASAGCPPVLAGQIRYSSVSGLLTGYRPTCVSRDTDGTPWCPMP